MKKITLIAASGLMAIAAQAQYTCDPSTSVVVNAGAKSVYYVTLSEDAIAQFQTAGATVNYVGPDADAGRNLWYWNGFNAGDESFPRVDFAEGGYVSVEVTGEGGWSGAGFAVDAPGLDLTAFNDDTHFHLAYMSPSGNGPASIALIILDKAEYESVPAKVALGDAFNDNGAVYPSIGPKIGDEWQGVDITFAQLKKIYPAFSPAHLSGWEGNLLSWLGGGTAGQTMAFDAIYFYNTGEAGVEAISVDDNVDFVVTANTINVMGANGIQLFNIKGQLVKATEGTTLGLTNLQPGVYVARCGNKIQKVVVR